jgi:hypothetical protein
MIKIVKWGWGITLNWIQDIANREFHITPVITYSWVDLNNKDFKSIKHGWGLAFEWGFWAVLFGICKLKDDYKPYDGKAGRKLIKYLKKTIPKNN